MESLTKVVKIFLVIFTLTTRLEVIEGKAQYVEPLSMGMKMSIPYDIANIFNRPIAGVTSFVLTVALALIIFFGIITSPFGYFFGVPSRKYVMGGNPDVEPHRIGSPRMAFDTTSYPSFEKTLLHLFDENDLKTQDCSLLVICYGHGIVNYLPQGLTQFYAIFSKKMTAIPAPFQNAMLGGIRDNTQCEGTYKNCPESAFSLVIKALLNLLPQSVKGDNFRKRKAAMYL